MSVRTHESGRRTSEKETDFSSAPLYDGQGNLAYFLGGQINCSTTIRDCSDVLRVLSMSDEPEEESAKVSEPSIHSNAKPSRVNFFKSLRRQPANKKSAAPVPGKVGMEQGLINKIEKMDFRTQMEMFYTAYSKVSYIHSRAPVSSVFRAHAK